LAQAQTWRASVGAQSPDKARQALAFLPNEIWIHTGDTITWTVESDEIHTITFLKAGQLRLLFTQGCPGFPEFSFGGASSDGSTCVSTPPLPKGQTFSVTFPTAGNYKLVCLVHSDMTGVVHVLDPAVPLPHDQAFYDKQANDQREVLLADTPAEDGHNQDDGPNSVTAGVGQTVATGGGHSTVSVMRFMHDHTIIHVGDTVEWTNDDPVNPHTITFGAEPANLILPSGNVTVDKDGALHGTISLLAGSVHSGLIISAPQERPFLPQAPLGATRFRITFVSAGIYSYICALHDGLGMKGTITVLP
jgi:plastocyanin